MLLTRLYLRNYRVYEDPLELDLPPGLVGIYGANGAGKSTLLEALVFSLWGKARTGKDDVRTAGVDGDCIAEVTFEHEGHLYLVRRSLSGINLAARAEVHCDGQPMAEGARDTGRYLHQVLGMDDAAFRASVFAEQKQIAAFSNRTPAERRQLVLQLLGITPLDAARDSARKDAREAKHSHDRLRSMLPDLDQLRTEVEDAAVVAAATATLAENDEAAAATLEAGALRAEAAFVRLDQVRQEYDTLIVEGRAARGLLDEAVAAVGQLKAEQAGLVQAAADLADLTPRAAGLAEAEATLERLTAVVNAERVCIDITVPPEPPAPDDPAVEESRRVADRARSALAGVAGRLEAVNAELARARQQADRSGDLSGAAECPLCGQALGAAFEKVQAHRAAEVAEAVSRRASLEESRGERERAARAAASQQQARTQEAADRRHARQIWEQAVAQREAAEQALRVSRIALSDVWPELATLVGPLAPRLVGVRQVVQAGREAVATVQRLQGRLERAAAVAAQLDRARDRLAEAEHRVTMLRDKVRGLDFRRPELDASASALREARAASERAATTARDARLASERAAARADGESRRLAEGEAQHAQLASLAEDSCHLGRLADLLGAFRNSIVATVGPRLALQAAELFGELTDHEYDRLEVDPQTYELQICDGGRVFGLDRFSGSEIDLANLALRVAISEHVRFQSGGTVGLLVLDEVFGPLDEERKARMLQALERLRGRFRQILVVTHDVDIKEQLPNAIEVQKRPGRRATARLLND